MPASLRRPTAHARPLLANPRANPVGTNFGIPAATARAFTLDPGEGLTPELLALHPAWRLQTGALRIDTRHDQPSAPAAAERPRELPLQLALPGDLLPPGLMPAWHQRYRLRALTAASVVPVDIGAAADLQARLLAEALQQQWRRIEDMAALRAGPVPDRVKHLMLLLAEQQAGTAAEHATLRLPSVRDIAETVDTSPESVSRVMSALKRMGLLAERKGTRTRFDTDRLAASLLPQGITRSVPLPGRAPLARA